MDEIAVCFKNGLHSKKNIIICQYFDDVEVLNNSQNIIKSIFVFDLSIHFLLLVILHDLIIINEIMYYILIFMENESCVTIADVAPISVDKEFKMFMSYCCIMMIRIIKLWL